MLLIGLLMMVLMPMSRIPECGGCPGGAGSMAGTGGGGSRTGTSATPGVRCRWGFKHYLYYTPYKMHLMTFS